MLTLNFDKEKVSDVSSTEVIESESIKLDNSNIIRNISFDQSEILWNI